MVKKDLNVNYAMLLTLIRIDGRVVREKHFSHNVPNPNGHKFTIYLHCTTIVLIIYIVLNQKILQRWEFVKENKKATKKKNDIG